MADDRRTSSLLIHAKNYYAHSSNKRFKWYYTIAHDLIWGTASEFILVTVLNSLRVWFMQYKNYNDNFRTTLVRSTTCTNPRLKFRTWKSVTEYALPWLFMHSVLNFRWHSYSDSIMKNSSWIFLVWGWPPRKTIRTCNSSLRE